MSTRLPLSFYLVFSLCLLIACKNSTPSSDSQTGSTQANPPVSDQIQAGSRPFNFEPNSVTDLVIAKSDPTQGDRWSGRLKKNAAGRWEISSGPDDAPLPDRLADHGFIEHLFSTFRTLEVSEAGVSMTAESAGLSIPKFFLQWSTPTNSYELRIGQEASIELGTFASFPKLSGDLIHRVKGATLAMLHNIKSFDRLRYRRLSPWELDRVQEFEIYSGVRKSFYAQRLNGDWGDETNHPYIGPVASWIERLMYLQVTRFNDQPREATQLYQRVSQQPAYRVILKDRFGNSQELMIALESGGWWGISTDRPQAAFRMDRDVAGYFLPPRVKKGKAISPNRK